MVKIKLELVLNKNGVKFLNFWDNINGKDIACEIINGKLIDNNGKGKEIFFNDFVKQVDLTTTDWILCN